MDEPSDGDERHDDDSGGDDRRKSKIGPQIQMEWNEFTQSAEVSWGFVSFISAFDRSEQGLRTATASGVASAGIRPWVKRLVELISISRVKNQKEVPSKWSARKIGSSEEFVGPEIVIRAPTRPAAGGDVGSRPTVPGV